MSAVEHIGRTPQERNASDYSELLATVKGAGLLERRRGRYLARVVLLTLLFGAAITALFVLGSSPWQLAVGAAFGILFTQAAFLAHDGAHRQIFTSGACNEWFGRIVGNGVVGLSYGWWMSKHTRHHSHPNQIGRDGDISSGALVLTPEAAAERAGITGALMRKQHWFFLPLLTLAGVDLHITAVKAVAGGEAIKHPVLEGGLLALRLLGFPVLAIIAAGPGMGAALVAVELAVFGISMGGSFAPNHKGMPIVPAGMTIDFLRRQVLMSRNISGGWPVAVMMGGLNYQIEHHLFPSMPSANLRRARPLVRAYCAERGIRYSETTFLGSYRIVLRYLARVGLRHADPFECPLAVQYR